MDLFTAIFNATIIAATPLIFAALGELMVEKSGVLNLGIEGMMLIGGACGVWCHFAGGPMILALAGALSSLNFRVLALTFMTNQYAARLALAIFGSGMSAFIGRGFGSTSVVAIMPLDMPVLSDLPVVGPLLFSYDLLVYFAFVMFFAASWFLYRL